MARFAPDVSMKRLVAFAIRLIGPAFICAALLAAAGCASKGHVESAPTGFARVVVLKGGARYATGPRNGRLLKVGELIQPGVFVQTADHSELELVLGGTQRDLVRMYENSLLAIETLQGTQTAAGGVETVHLNLQAGRLYGVVRALGPGSNYEVRLPNGVAGTRGAVFEITAEGVVTVRSGMVLLSFVRHDHSVTTQVITAAHQFDARTGALTSVSEKGKPALAGGGP